MIYIRKRFERFDYLAVRLIFFQFGTADRNSDGIYAQSRVDISGIGFDIVDRQSEPTDGRDKIL